MKKALKIIFSILLVIIITLAIFASVYIYKGYSLYKEILSTTSIEDKIEKIQQDRNYVKLKDMPTDFKNAIVDIEDNRFYSHSAIDVISLIRALYVNITDSSATKQGGSTITQQVAKNLFLTHNQDATRKIAELFFSKDLEDKYDKDTILEIYTNIIYYGDGYYGIKEAANGYFDKEPIDMTTYESTLLAGVPNAPSVYAPTVNPDLAAKRQKYVILAMVKYGHLSEEKKNELFTELEKYIDE